MNLEELDTFFKQVCHYDRHLQAKYNILNPGEIEYRLTVGEIHLSSPQTCHGGVLSSLMDSTLGLTALSYAVTRGMFCSTVEFKINFIQEAKQGMNLLGVANLDYTGNRLVVTSGTLIDEEDGKMIAKGMGTFNLYPYSKKINP